MVTEYGQDLFRDNPIHKEGAATGNDNRGQALPGENCDRVGGQPQLDDRRSDSSTDYRSVSQTEKSGGNASGVWGGMGDTGTGPADVRRVTTIAGEHLSSGSGYVVSGRDIRIHEDVKSSGTIFSSGSHRLFHSESPRAVVETVSNREGVRYRGENSGTHSDNAIQNRYSGTASHRPTELVECRSRHPTAPAVQPTHLSGNVEPVFVSWSTQRTSGDDTNWLGGAGGASHHPGSATMGAIKRTLRGLRGSDSPASRDFSLPLHIKHVGQISIQQWITLVRNDVNLERQFERAFALLTDISILAAAAAEIRERYPKMEIKPALLSEQDIARLLEAHKIEEVTQGEIQAWVKVFSVSEMSKGRRRWICAPWSNDVILEVPECVLPGVMEIEEGIQQEGAVLMDLPWWYGQIPIPKECRVYYGFKAFGRYFVCTTVPTGSRQVPAMAQALAKSWGRLVAPGDVYLDNFRWCAPATMWNGIIQSVHGNAARWQLSISEPIAGTKYDYLGAHCDHIEKTIGLTERMKMKVSTAKAAGHMTVREVLSAVGLLVCATHIVHLAMAKFYIVFKFIRRQYKKELDETVPVWNCVTTAVESWKEQLLNAAPRRVGRSSRPAWQIITDACPEGFGFWIFQGEKIIAVSGSFHVGEHIHLLEARALLYAISHLPHSYVDQPIAIYVDNSSVNGALQRTWSRAFTLNIIIGKIHEELRSKGYVLDGIVQVLSKDNIADVLSRIGRNSYMEM